MIRVAFVVLFVAVLSAQKAYQPKVETLPGPEIKQPIAYSHKKHVAMGLTCTGCHTMPGEGMQATYPKEQFCMGCHQSVKTDSSEIQKLAAFAGQNRPVPWVRVYEVPEMVWFSHAVHVKESKLACSECHGEVAQKDVLFKEKSTSMPACMECHALKKAANGCDTCHSSQ